MRDRRDPNKHYSNSRWSNLGTEESAFPAPTGISQNSIGSLFFEFAEELHAAPFARFRTLPDNIWHTVSWSDAAGNVARVAEFLRNTCGVEKGARVAILSATRYEWMIADLAILSIGAVSTPIFQTNSAAEAHYILKDSGARHIFVENKEQYNKVSSLFSDSSTRLLDSIIAFESELDAPSHPKLFILSDILNKKAANIAAISAESKEITRSSLASFVYTSGTTGTAKGVVQTHGNHISMLDGVLLSGLLGDGKGMFLFLPLAHSFARLIAYSTIAGGGDMIFPAVVDKKSSRFDAKTMFRDISESGPKYFPSVPRIYEKIMTSLSGGEPKTFKEKLIRWAITNYPILKQDASRSIPPPILTKLKWSAAQTLVQKVREQIFGKNFLYGISGGAPLGMDTLTFFEKIDIRIYEGYGLTETTPALTANTKKFFRPGSVGRAFEGVELKIAENDGEILARGGNIALGYHNRPEDTAAVFFQDGWFATGDIGEIDEEGYLKITDRKKELIVTANGKNVAPALIEGKAKSSPYISQALVYGDREPFLVALITLDEANVQKWAASRGLLKSLPLSDIPEVRELIRGELKKSGDDLASYEQIKNFAILPEDLTVENGMLSATMKLKRKVVYERYAELIHSMYKHSPNSQAVE